jgi:type IV fimbrial biogenesis protein FimT
MAWRTVELAQRAGQRGVSITEGMIVVAILGLLAGLAAPSFRRLVLENRLIGNTNQLLAAVHQGRGEALKRNAVVKLCPIMVGAAEAVCATPAGKNWSYGWLVYIDADDNGVPDTSADVLVTHHERRPSISVRLQGVGEAVAFSPSGLVRGATSGNPPSWEICLPDVDAWTALERRGRMVSVNVIGRAETVKSAAKLAAEGFSCLP